jgi:tetratricopeptide (TPR) repeat protein
MHGDITKSEALTRRAVDIFHEIEDGVNIIWSTDNLARSLIERGNIVEAKKLLLDLEPYAVEMNEVGFLPEIYIHLSEIARQETRIGEALNYAVKATKIVATDDQYSGSRSFSAVAKALVDNNDYTEARKYMGIALKMVENTNYVYVKAIIDFDYAQFLLSTGNPIDKVVEFSRKAKDAFRQINAQGDLKKVLIFEADLPS